MLFLNTLTKITNTIFIKNIIYDIIYYIESGDIEYENTKKYYV